MNEILPIIFPIPQYWNQNGLISDRKLIFNQNKKWWDFSIKPEINCSFYHFFFKLHNFQTELRLIDFWPKSKFIKSRLKWKLILFFPSKSKVTNEVIVFFFLFWRVCSAIYVLFCALLNWQTFWWYPEKWNSKKKSASIGIWTEINFRIRSVSNFINF